MRSRFQRWFGQLARHIWRYDGAQMVEFAVALPLLVLFVVGIFDFSAAFTLKQKLTNVTRDAVRVAAADPGSDVPSSTSAVPASVSDAFQLISNYFVANKINLCGMTTASFVHTSPAVWTYSDNANGCPSAGVTVIINRGYYYPQSLSVAPANATCTSQALGGQTAMLSTCVSISYPYQWRFGRVASLLGSGPALPPTLTATAVAMNEN